MNNTPVEKQDFSEELGANLDFHMNIQNSKFAQVFNSLTEKEKEYVTFFSFSDDKIYEIICAYYEDITAICSGEFKNFSKFLLRFLCSQYESGSFNIDVSFDGIDIGVKKDSLCFCIDIQDAQDHNDQSSQKSSVIKLIQHQQQTYQRI